jgi:flagellar biosynthesis activator protein FlaF
VNALAMAQRAYSAPSAPTRTLKDTEYDAIALATCNLRQAAELGVDGFPALAAALHRNRKLWTIFATDVADPENKMPAELKARVFYLAEFTIFHTSRVLARKATVDPLIEINTAIMRGLRSGDAS